VQFHEAVDDVLDNDPSLVFRDSPLLLDLGLQGLAVAVLDHHDLQVLVLEDVEAFEEVGTVAHVHEAGFTLGESQLDGLDHLVGLVFDLLHVDEFDGYLLFGLVIHAFEDAAVGTFADHVIDHVFADVLVFDGASVSLVFLVSDEQGLDL
jgi:hypothetical protein